MDDVISGIIAVITAVIGVGKNVYNVLLRDSRKKQYYEELLKPFVVAYKINSDINITSFVYSKVDRSNDNIPKYVFYLIDKCQKEDEIEDKCIDNQNILKKVLIHDYFDLYSNDYNKRIHIVEMVRKLLIYFMIMVSFIFLFLSVWDICNFLIGFVKEGITDNYDSLIHGIIYLLSSIFLALIPDFLYNDMYTVKKDKIEDLINNKVKRFDKVQDKYVL